MESPPLVTLLHFALARIHLVN